MFLNLLQASVEGQSQFLSNLTTSEAFFMVIVVGIAGMIVQWRLRSVVAKYSQVPMPTGLTGAEIAEKMLCYNGVNDVKITSPSALKFLMSSRYLKSFIQLVDVETFNNNIELIGEYNNLTPTFEHLLKNPGVNDSVLVLLTNKALTKFGHSSIKTFTYNAMLEMIKYNPRAFKVAVNKDLVATFGYDRAANLIRSLANVTMWSFKNSELYKDLLQSPNRQLVEDLFTEYNFQTNNILNTLIDTSDN